MEKERRLSDAPKNPKDLTEDDINQMIRSEIGFDPYNIFKDTEGDQDGMARKMNLKNQIEMEQEIRKR